MLTSPEAVFRYSELRRFISQHLGKTPAPSTLNAWMDAVLDLPPYQKDQPREYGLEDAMALVFWARAGELARRGDRKTRSQRRINLYLEAINQWHSKTRPN